VLVSDDFRVVDVVGIGVTVVSVVVVFSLVAAALARCTG
jgi:hypothetical protein